MVTNVEIFFGLFNNIFWDLLTVFSFDFVHLKLNQSCPTSNMFVYQSSLFFYYRNLRNRKDTGNINLTTMSDS